MKQLKLFLFSFAILSFTSCNQIKSPTKKDDVPKTETNDKNTDANKPEVTTTPDKPKPDNPGSNDNTNNNTPTDNGAVSGIKLSKATYMKAEENKMVDEINLVRTNPAGYVKFVNEYIAQMEKDKAEGVGFSNVDDEIATAKELISELKITQPLSFLQPKEAIYNAAKKHGDEGKAKGSLDHQGSDGKWPWDRVKASAPECADGNENLVGGSADVRRSVMMLLVDSGIPGRGHRKTMLNPVWSHVACYHVGQVGQMPNYWIQKFGKCN